MQYMVRVFHAWTLKSLVPLANLLVVFLVGKSRQSLAAAARCHPAKILPFWLLSIRRATDGDLLACKDMGADGDSMLSPTLI
jgi:hypothetical protein